MPYSIEQWHCWVILQINHVIPAIYQSLVSNPTCSTVKTVTWLEKSSCDEPQTPNIKPRDTSSGTLRYILILSILVTYNILLLLAPWQVMWYVTWHLRSHVTKKPPEIWKNFSANDLMEQIHNFSPTDRVGRFTDFPSVCAPVTRCYKSRVYFTTSCCYPTRKNQPYRW